MIRWMSAMLIGVVADILLLFVLGILLFCISVVAYAIIFKKDL